MPENIKQHTFSPDSFVEWFQQRPHLQHSMPWGANLVAHKEGLHKGCKCKHKAKLLNYKKAFETVVLQTYAQNNFLVNQLKKELEADLINFEIDGVNIASY